MTARVGRGHRLGRLGRLAAVVGFGGALHLSALSVGYLLVQYQANRITASCIDTDCQPQYYFGVGLAYLFVVLPMTYLLGWVAIIIVGRLTTMGLESRLVSRLAAAAFVTSGALVLHSIWLVSLPEGNRWRLWMGAIAVAPIAVSGGVAACTPCRRRDSADASTLQPSDVVA